MLNWILTIAILMHDTHGYSRAMPSAMAQAIADVAPDRATAALMVVFAFRESSYRADVKGDGGASGGAWQTPCARTPRDVRGQAVLALAIMRASMLACPEFPLAVYASGSCASQAGRRISTARIAEAKRLEGTP
jgi:hypothetical protein